MTIEQIEAKLARRPHSPLFARLAEMYLAEGHTAEAKELCRSGLELYPTYLTAFLILARCYAAEGDHQTALSALNRARVIAPYTPAIRKLQNEWVAVLRGADAAEIEPIEEGAVSVSEAPPIEPAPSPIEETVTPLEELPPLDIVFEVPQAAISGTETAPPQEPEPLALVEPEPESPDQPVAAASSEEREVAELPAAEVETAERDVAPSLHAAPPSPETEAALHAEAPAPAEAEPAATEAQVAEPEAPPPAVSREAPEAHEVEPPVVEEANHPSDAAVAEVPAAQSTSPEAPEVAAPEVEEAGAEVLSAEAPEAPTAAPAVQETSPPRPQAPVESMPEQAAVAGQVPEDDGRIVSATLAEIYARQGAIGEAILTYRLLKRHRPERAQECDQRIKELEAKLQSKGQNGEGKPS